MGGDPEDVYACLRGRRRHRAFERRGMALRARRAVRALPDLRQRALALRAAPGSNRSRLSADVRRSDARSTDAAVKRSPRSLPLVGRGFAQASPGTSPSWGQSTSGRSREAGSALQAGPPRPDSTLAAAADLRAGRHWIGPGTAVGRSVIRLSHRQPGGNRLGSIGADDPHFGIDSAGDPDQRCALADSCRGAAGDGAVLAAHRAGDPARRRSQLAVGLFIGTFAYSMTVLRDVN